MILLAARSNFDILLFGIIAEPTIATKTITNINSTSEKDFFLMIPNVN